jgi:hypothetical protein
VDKYTYFASGKHRDAFCAVGANLVLKMHKIEVGKKNQNQEEWQSYDQNPSFRSFVPFVYGYFEQNLKGIPVATLLVSRVAFSFEEMLQRQQHMCPTMP